MGVIVGMFMHMVVMNLGRVVYSHMQHEAEDGHHE